MTKVTELPVLRPPGWSIDPASQAMLDSIEAGERAKHSSVNLLKRAVDLQSERAANYDSPGGERSMGKTIAAFNAITGRDLQESEGWMLQALLKMVRDRSTKTGHVDSCEDLVSYSALMGEARLQGR